MYIGTSLYQQWNQYPTQPLAKQADIFKSTRPCPAAVEVITIWSTWIQWSPHQMIWGHDLPPAWGKFCNHCKIPHHFASVCWQKLSESASALVAQVYYDSQSDAYHTISPIQDINEIPALICSSKLNHRNCKVVLINIFPNSEASISDMLSTTTPSSTIEFKITPLITKFRGYKHVESRTPPTKSACGGVQWLFLLEHHSFFLLHWEGQTLIKLKLKQASKES